MRREDLYRATGAVVLVRCETQRGWDRYDHLIDDSGAAAVEGREYPSAAKAIAAAAGACDGPYLFVELRPRSEPARPAAHRALRRRRDRRVLGDRAGGCAVTTRARHW